MIYSSTVWFSGEFFAEMTAESSEKWKPAVQTYDKSGAQFKENSDDEPEFKPDGPSDSKFSLTPKVIR